jgi:AcrR family transcriptional regulator
MGRTRAGLLDGAVRAFAERGLRGSTMQSVAATAGVAKATLYNHFRTKDEVARALLAAELDRLTALVAGLAPGAALTALADEVAGHPVLRRVADDEPAVLTGPADQLAGALGGAGGPVGHGAGSRRRRRRARGALAARSGAPAGEPAVRRATAERLAHLVRPT